MATPRIVLLGAEGQLGSAIASQLHSQLDKGIFPNQVWCFSHRALDITDRQAVNEAMQEIAPTHVINAAAYTAVDKAEQDAAAAESVNHLAVAGLAEVCSRHRAALIHFSTDYVFSGLSDRPYYPDDHPDPINVYGKTKYLGELAALRYPRALVVRLSWLYSHQHTNFLTTMLRLFREKPQLQIVSDQTGAPTYVAGVAELVERIIRASDPGKGIFHWCDRGEISWYEFAVAILQQATQLNLVHESPILTPISSEAYASPAKRPSYSVLDTQLTSETFAITPNSWQENLSTALEKIAAGGP